MTDPLLRNAIDWLQYHGSKSCTAQALSGGSICRAWYIQDQSGARYFLKTHAQPPMGFFDAEAQGLAELSNNPGLRIPAVRHIDENFLLLEFIESRPASAECWERLGHALAAMRDVDAPSFGFHGDNFCGSTAQPNPRMDDGHQFFVEHRLLYQGKLARTAGLLSANDLVCLEQLGAKLRDLIPASDPILLHGDLWSGNVMFDDRGTPVLFDPAAYWGWAEAEIAMTHLFGGFDARFYSAWNESADPEPGWQQRLPLYNLYHLLNHLNLFGRSYLGQVQSVLEKFS